MNFETACIVQEALNETALFWHANTLKQTTKYGDLGVELYNRHWQRRIPGKQPDTTSTIKRTY
jgi:hypothetical protein